MYSTTSGRSKGAFSMRPTSDTAHPGCSMSTRGNSKRRKQLVMKYSTKSEENAFKKCLKMLNQHYVRNPK